MALIHIGELFISIIKQPLNVVCLDLNTATILFHCNLDNIRIDCGYAKGLFVTLAHVKKLKCCF